MLKRASFLSGLFLLSLLTGCGTTQTTVSTGPRGATGPAGLIYLGAYNANTAYVPTDVATYQGSSFVALTASVGVPPTGNAASDADWELIAQAGAAGVAGSIGATGAQGISGLPGVPGPQGVAGTAGIAGPQGMQGSQGPAGAAGIQGSTGPQGLAGEQGSTGAAGPVGATGAQGLTGIQGPVGLQGTNGLQGATGAQGPEGATGLQGTTGVQGPAGPAGALGAQGVAGQNMVSFLAGLQLGVQGDSISAIFNNAWQNVVIARTGMLLNPINQNARTGRNMTEAFEVYGTTTPGSPLLVNQGTVTTPLGPVSTGTPGNTLAQDLDNIDVMIVDLGTNDQSILLGALGDPTNANTYYGNMRWIAETYLTAKPSMRLVFVTLQHNAFGTATVQQQMAEAMVNYGKSAGIPVINMFALGGVNAITAPTLTRDGTHPSDFAFAKFYGPVIAQGLQQIF